MLHTALIVVLTRPTIALFLRRRRMILQWSQHLTALDRKRRRQPRMVIHSLIRQHYLHPLHTILTILTIHPHPTRPLLTQRHRSHLFLFHRSAGVTVLVLSSMWRPWCC